MSRAPLVVLTLTLAFLLTVLPGILVAMGPTGTGNTFERTYGGGSSDFALSVQQTSDGGYVVAGRTDSFGAGGNDFWVLKLNSAGTVQWNKTYGGSGEDFANSVQQTSDGGYVVAGGTSSFGAVGDFWVLKLDSAGGISAACGLGSSSSATVATTSVTGGASAVSAVTSAASVSSTSATVSSPTGVTLTVNC